eukprot:TRINITY_DN11879_c0_g2_i6.p1 TRINITY_DN11879_c0_g2~~TRINITY_DN11879_c0_g2_i6.p1  ORF type:complete len:380 (+),score=56.76 TRINITY_DN11879_c0_g2_i6:58-1140(+)
MGALCVRDVPDEDKEIKDLFAQGGVEYVFNRFTKKAPSNGGPGAVRMLIVQLDYVETHKWNPQWAALDTRWAGDEMVRLGGICGCEDITILRNNQCTIAAVTEALEAIADRMEDDDYFVYFYTGHGAQIAHDDDSEEEADGLDEAWCLVDDEGRCTEDTWMRDDLFAELVTTNFSEKARILVISDSCHSATICDFASRDELWEHGCGPTKSSFQIVSLSGCADAQTSAGTGKGGVFSNVLFEAITELSVIGHLDTSVAQVYNVMRGLAKDMFRSKQQVTLSMPSHLQPDDMAWPLVPADGQTYQAPLFTAWSETGRNMKGVTSDFAGVRVMHMKKLCADAKEESDYYVDKFEARIQQQRK